MSEHAERSAAVALMWKRRDLGLHAFPDCEPGKRLSQAPLLLCRFWPDHCTRRNALEESVISGEYANRRAASEKYGTADVFKCTACLCFYHHLCAWEANQIDEGGRCDNLDLDTHMYCETC